ncbi:PAS domain S-box-containing protein/HDIG domain-containing protein [Tistlia consotensis]|uniref:PAS domain S-box-containing protein/HDIG domain-containing protein n=1 Tax=Tistlia consotensis USBA 355 TaxID=560819 RepID=A0A1Y6CJB0_9PROT|nr:HD domain-containing phosphohydrolase [Tistlia consotensis]SMF69779.1 PAS domain S-box-containing protein/HDIG domain-containing protein [Tistlia consotensis USBA 355]SNS05325.1 PAS domain S-box-containing protein/HDIG domain-containing protein [Tistlia consotensis]
MDAELSDVGPSFYPPAVTMTPLGHSTVFEMLPLPAFIKDINLVITHANRALCRFLGRPASDLIGKTSAQLDIVDAVLHQDIDRRVLTEGGTATSPFELRLKGRKTVRGEIFKMRLDDAYARPAGLLVLIIDRTEQRATEQHLAEAEALQRVVVESISDSVLLLDAACRFTFATPNVRAIFGIDSEEVLSRRTLRELIGRDTCLLRSLPRDRETRNIETSVLRPDGSRRDLLINAKPIRIGSSRWLLSCHDVTEQVQALRRLKVSMVKTVQALCATVERRDPYVIGHQNRVADIALAIGRRLRLDESRLEGLRLAAIVHDIGKINVPSDILNKPGRLSEPEFEIVKTHAEVGYEILKDIDFPWPVARMVREHHEAIDGSGYPQGLTGDRLLLESRILSVADVLEAVTSHRPYRPGLGLEKAIEILRALRGRKLDAEVVDACLELIERQEITVPGWSTAESA